jgi:hypothetical protein
MNEQTTQPAASDSPPMEVPAVTEGLQGDNTRIRAAHWEGYSPDTLAALLDP